MIEQTYRLSVVVPVRNEAGNVAPLISEIQAACASLGPVQIVYVDDGSTDGTLAELQRLAQTFAQLTIVQHAHSCGQSAAVCTGAREALAPLIATIDGDGQNDPAFIPRLVEALEAAGPTCGLAAGQRVGRKATGFKKIQSRIANGVRGFILKDNTRDSGCGLKCLRRDLLLSLPYFDGLHRFLPALVSREGLSVVHVDVVDRPRHSGQSNYGLFDRLWVGILDLFGVWWLIKRRRRVPQIVKGV